MKQYVVIGCGKFGSSLARALYELDNEVLAVDINGEKIDEIMDYVTHGVEADVTDERVLEELGISNADVVIVAIGSNFQASVMATLVSKELGVKKILAKASDENHGKVLKRLGADRIIYPEEDMAKRVAHNLASSNILDFINISSEYSLVEVKHMRAWTGKTLEDINIHKKYGVTVLAIKSGKDLKISPKSSELINDGDILVIVGRADDVKKIEEIVGEEDEIYRK